MIEYLLIYEMSDHKGRLNLFAENREEAEDAVKRILISLKAALRLNEAMNVSYRLIQFGES